MTRRARRDWSFPGSGFLGCLLFIAGLCGFVLMIAWSLGSFVFYAGQLWRGLQ